MGNLPILNPVRTAQEIFLPVNLPDLLNGYFNQAKGAQEDWPGQFNRVWKSNVDATTRLDLPSVRDPKKLTCFVMEE